MGRGTRTARQRLGTLAARLAKVNVQVHKPGRDGLPARVKGFDGHGRRFDATYEFGKSILGVYRDGRE